MKLAHEILELNDGDFGPLGRDQIAKLCLAGMIDPFTDTKIRTDINAKPVISYGLAEAGYDISLGYNFKIPIGAMDPKNANYREIQHAKAFYLDPNSFILGESKERFDIPLDVRVISISKSTNLRVGLFVPISPLEPGWKGILTIELTNFGNKPVKIYPGEGIAQLIFELIQPTKGYHGSYQNQEGVTGALPQIHKLQRPDNWG